MSSEQNREKAEKDFLASFSTSEQQSAEALKSILDDLVVTRELVSGSLDQLIEFDEKLGSDQDGGQEPISHLPISLTVGCAFFIQQYLRDAYDVILRDAEYDLSNYDTDVLLCTIRPVETVTDGDITQETSISGDSEVDEADFDAGAFEVVNATPLFPEVSDDEPTESDSGFMANWPEVRTSLEAVFERLLDLSDEQKSTSGVELDLVEQKINLTWAELAEREWFMKRMAGRRSRFGKLYQLAYEFCQARRTNQDIDQPDVFRKNFYSG